MSRVDQNGRVRAHVAVDAANAAHTRGEDQRDPRSSRDDVAVSMEPLSVRIPTALKLTGIGRSKLYELIASGDIDVVKIGTATLVTMASLRRLIERGAT